MGESARNSPSTSAAAAAAAGAVHAFLGDDHDDRRGGTHDGGPAARKRILCAPFHPGRTSDGNNHERRPFGGQQTQGRSLAHGAFASIRGVFGGFPIRAHRPDRTGQTHHREPPGLGPVGTPGRVPGTRRPLVLQGTGGTGQPGLCRGLLRRVARIRRRYGQRPAPRRDHFLLPVRVRAGILRLSDGDRGRGGRPVQDATAGGIFDAGGDRRLAGGLCVGDEGIRGLYRTVHCSAETRPGGVPRLVFLHLFGVADLFVLSFVALRCV